VSYLPESVKITIEFLIYS